MSKFTKVIAALMLTVAVFCVVGCKKDPDNGGNNNGGGNGGGSNPTTEGIYLGIIGFNQHLYEKEISLLNASTKESFISHINGLETRDGTGLYWADNTALMRLKSFGEPPRLTTVALVTFTDGLDNVSLDDSETNPDNYPTKEAYLEGLSNKIRQGEVHNKDITAYTIGLKGNDVNDVDEFHVNIKKLASEDSNGIEVSDMNHALQQFTEIAESLHSVTNTASLTLLIPPGYNDGQIIRFTFDNISTSSTDAENSTLYIECIYKRTENGRRLENITYHGWQNGVSSVSSFEKEGRYYRVAFENLMKENGDLVSDGDKRYLQLFYKTSSGEWQPDSEFTPDTFSAVIEKQSSALILLVLDCTTSLGSEFSSLKNAAKQFVETLVSSNNGGGNGGGGNGGGNGTYNGHDYVDLGLPSGTLWATCNVGATTPEGYGDYFAWGETTMKSKYNWSTYRYCNGVYNKLTKYCNDSSYGNNGFTDNLTTLQFSDDAARVNWGGDWRMPTKAEWEELMSNATVTWTTQNGVCGRKFTTSKGDSIFLPAAGFISDDDPYSIGILGNYWLSLLSTEEGPYQAWALEFNSEDCGLYFDNSRYPGFPIRAVLPASKN